MPLISGILSCCVAVAKAWRLISGSDSLIDVVVLDPTQKMSWFDKEWDSDTRNKAWDLVCSKRVLPPTAKTTKKSSKIRRLLSDSYDEPQAIPSSPSAAFPAWEASFNEYMNNVDYLSEDQSIVTWWGVFSSERVFSGGGITITKLRNRLRGDIVEALQLLKYALGLRTVPYTVYGRKAMVSDGHGNIRIPYRMLSLKALSVSVQREQMGHVE
ncbi:uncharacterized protein EV420DRAFT_1749580 [Desarmillaria tabescens]|uniref:HAT C-terminal dimerisation domain-containing protein n=1 Tax=Armillaria tabescens TaxID=1929756 RepID=A0AA39K882_ARMTA|nr:uncharacterized protein EV420DRAFT_1749580 [Desarmillaria tabescens]KAK0454018.1 hypothetical protein EV420DRAFT_1749580 [Desarmillaria tabescens]